MKIVIQPYTSEWPVVFEYEKYVLFRALGSNVAIEHIGSTSVPGLAAKPVIDIMVGLFPEDSLDSIIKPLIDYGYMYVGNYECLVPERRFFVRMDTPDGFSIAVDAMNEKHTQRHTHHVHAVYYGGKYWEDQIRFREHLRTNPADRLAYELLKKDFVKQGEGTDDDYNRAKVKFIENILCRY